MITFFEWTYLNFENISNAFTISVPFGFYTLHNHSRYVNVK